MTDNDLGWWFTNKGHLWNGWVSWIDPTGLLCKLVYGARGWRIEKYRKNGTYHSTGGNVEIHVAACLIRDHLRVELDKALEQSWNLERAPEGWAIAQYVEDRHTPIYVGKTYNAALVAAVEEQMKETP